MISVAGISENLRELPRISNMFQILLRCSRSIDVFDSDSGDGGGDVGGESGDGGG